MPIKLLSLNESPFQILQDEKSRHSLYIHLIILLVLILLGAVNHFSNQDKVKAPPPLSPEQLKGSKDELLAKVHSIWIYPIKSCAGIQLVGPGLERPEDSQTTQRTGQEVLRKGFESDRKWCIVNRDPSSKYNGTVISLREESRLTLIKPSFSQASTDSSQRLEKTLKLEIASGLNKENLPPIEFLLEPSDQVLKGWKEEQLEVWGDQVFGRVVELVERKSSWKGSPSEWFSEFLGYPAQLLQFSPPSLAPLTSANDHDTASVGTRKAWPINKPPLGFSSSQGEWASPAKRNELLESRGIEFQDEYPFLITSVESLEEIDSQIQNEAARSRQKLESGNSTHKSRPIGGFQADDWDGRKLQMQRFRPSIVLESLEKDEGQTGSSLKPFNEDSFESLFIVSSEESNSIKSQAGNASKNNINLWASSTNLGYKSVIHLVARCERCRLTTVDPESSEIDSAVPLKFLARKEGGHYRVKKKRNGPCFGVYGIPEKVGKGYGSIKAGDLVVARWRPLELDDEPGRHAEES